MRRLSVLEQEQGSNYAKARQAEESLAKSTKVHTALIRDLEAKNAELSVELVSLVFLFLIALSFRPYLTYCPSHHKHNTSSASVVGLRKKLLP